MSAVDNTVIELEQRLLNPAIRNDRAAVDALLDEDFFEFGSSGKRWSRQDTIATLANEAFSQIKASDFRAHKLSLETMLITYKTEVNGTVALRSSIWKKSNNEWKLFFHQGTKIPQAFTLKD